MRNITLKELVAEMTYQFTPDETIELLLFPNDIKEKNILLLFPIVIQYFNELMGKISNSITEDEESEWDIDDRHNHAEKFLIENNYNPNLIILTIN